MKGTVMKYNFDEIIDRNNAYSSKYGPMENNSTEYNYPLLFSVADMDFRSSEAITKGIQKAVDRGIYGYSILTDDNGKEFYDAVISWYKRRQNIELKRENIFYTEGSLDAAEKAVKAFSSPDDGVIICKPVYGPFESSVIKPNGRKVVVSNLKRDETGYYTMDYEDFEEKCKDPNNTIFLMCSPHNPVGRVWTEEELTKIYEICQRNNVLIISDEVHCDFIRPGIKFTSMYHISKGKGVIICGGIGKTFNLAQFRPGVAIVTDPDLIDRFASAASLPWITTTEIKMNAMIAGYTQSDEWLSEVLEYIDGNIDVCLEFFKEKMPKVKCLRPEGTYIIWMDFSAYGLTDEEIHKRIYENAWVILEDGIMFDEQNGKCFQRMCLPAPRSRVLEALERIRKEFE